MTSMVMAVVAQVVVAAAPQSNVDLDRAARRSMIDDRPLVVLLGAPWCPACVTLKQKTLPKVAKSGGMSDVEFVYVDVDKNPALTRQLARGGSIPQLIRLEFRDGKWNREYLIGGRQEREVTDFIQGKKAKKLPFGISTLPLGRVPALIGSE